MTGTVLNDDQSEQASKSELPLKWKSETKSEVVLSMSMFAVESSQWFVSVCHIKHKTTGKQLQDKSFFFF